MPKLRHSIICGSSHGPGHYTCSRHYVYNCDHADIEILLKRQEREGRCSTLLRFSRGDPYCLPKSSSACQRPRCNEATSIGPGGRSDRAVSTRNYGARRPAESKDGGKDDESSGAPSVEMALY